MMKRCLSVSLLNVKQCLSVGLSVDHEAIHVCQYVSPCSSILTPKRRIKVVYVLTNGLNEKQDRAVQMD